MGKTKQLFEKLRQEELQSKTIFLKENIIFGRKFFNNEFNGALWDVQSF